MHTGKYDSDAAVAGAAAGLRGQSRPAGDAGLRLQRVRELEKLVNKANGKEEKKPPVVDYCVQLIESLLKKEPGLFRPAGRAGSGKSSESS